MASCLLTWKNLTEIDHVKKKKKTKKKIASKFFKKKNQISLTKKKKKGAKISHNDKIDLLGKKGEKKYFA